MQGLSAREYSSMSNTIEPAKQRILDLIQHVNLPLESKFTSKTSLGTGLRGSSSPLKTYALRLATASTWEERGWKVTSLMIERQIAFISSWMSLGVFQMLGEMQCRGAAESGEKTTWFHATRPCYINGSTNMSDYSFWSPTSDSIKIRHNFSSAGTEQGSNRSALSMPWT